MSDQLINPDKLYSLEDVIDLEGTSRGEMYRRLNQGQYAPVVKDGRRTKILGRGIIARRAAKLERFKPSTKLDDETRTGWPCWDHPAGDR
jgi:hypothetical protein